MTLSLDGLRPTESHRTPQIKPQARSVPQWIPMTWDAYEQWRDGTTSKTAQWYFDRNSFLVRDMGWDGINHAQVKDLFILLISLWCMAHPDRTAQSMSGGLLEKPGLKVPLQI